MISFFFKPKKLSVDAFTCHPGVYEYFKIDQSKNFLPSWWKSMPPTFEVASEYGLKFKQSTIKRCDGLSAIFKTGIMLPLWCDVILESSEGGWRYQYSAPDGGVIDTHSTEQLGPEFNNYHHIKILSPWSLVEKTGVDFLMISPMWNQIPLLNSMHQLPGVMNFKTQVATHVNALLPKTDCRVELEAGSPIAQLIPLSDAEVVVHQHLLSLQEYDMKFSKFGYQSSFLGKYKKRKAHVL